MKRLGLRGRYSPMTSPNTTDAQKAEILRILDELKNEGRTHTAEVRYSTYIGPGCAAEHGDLTVVADGRIWAMVTREGTSY